MKENRRIIDHPRLTFTRGKPVRFSFQGRWIEAYEGETLAAAMLAAGVMIFSRSSKYHRPRGAFCLSGHCGQCMMRVDGVPNVRTCRTPVRDGMRVESQNAWPSLQFDLAAASGYLGPLLRPGFPYRWFKRQRRIYHLWERFLRGMAGLGNLPQATYGPKPLRREATPDVLVVGGGIAGLAAAWEAARVGASVIILEKDAAPGGRLRYETDYFETPDFGGPRPGFVWASDLVTRLKALKNCQLVSGTTALSWYDEGVLLGAGPDTVWILRPGALIVATGGYSRPFVFGNNDLPGIYLGRGLQRLINEEGIRPGRRALVATDNDEGYQLANQMMEAGIEVMAIIDRRPDGTGPTTKSGVCVLRGWQIDQANGRKRLKGVKAVQILSPDNPPNGGKLHRLFACDMLVLSGPITPANDLVFQRTGLGEYVLESAYHIARHPAITADMRIETELYVAGEATGGHPNPR